jgi:hypothetical protein
MMSFLVGGGCDDTAVYVELVVDGVSVMRATGEVEHYCLSPSECYRDSNLGVFQVAVLKKCAGLGGMCLAMLDEVLEFGSWTEVAVHGVT